MPNKPKMVWYICQQCKRPFLTEARALRRGKGRHCSHRCSAYAHLVAASVQRDQWGHLNPAWKGGRTLHHKGYVYRYAPDHPRASNGYVFEHILVAESMLGRYLEEGETVHHKNGIKSDNRPENIQVFDSPGAHSKHHAALRRAVAERVPAAV